MLNYIAGNRLVGEQEGKKKVFKIIALKPLKNYLTENSDIDIAITKGSTTKVPNLWIDKTTNEAYWDCPGFGDNRGPEQEIINGFYIR